MDSSSDDEHAQLRMELPQVSLASFHKKDPKANFNKAKHRLRGQRVRFPEQAYRDLVRSLSTTADASLDDLYDIDESSPLPDFAYKPPEQDSALHDLDEGLNYLQPLVYEDSGDSESEDETDITEQRRSSSEKRTLKDLFRDESRNDTFLGRVLNFLSKGGLGGGGMVPGALKHGDGQWDAEKGAGGEAEDNSIELRNLDFSELNEEAKRLISAHVPEAGRPPPKVAFEDPEKEERSERHADHEEPFYQEIPDYLREETELDLPDNDFLDINQEYVAPPKQVHAGVLLSLLKLYQNQNGTKSSALLTLYPMLADEQLLYSREEPHTNPLKLMKAGRKKLAGKLGKIRGRHDREDKSDSDLEQMDAEAAKLPSFQNAKPKTRPRLTLNQANLKLAKKLKKKRDHKLRITVHISDILQRQRFILRMCRALMLYGAPTHRLEEYMVMTSRVLEIDGQFVYFPGTMIVAFGDAATRTSEVHLVRCAQGVNLSKLSDTHQIYKSVIHDLVGVEESLQKLEELMRRRNQYPPWVCVVLYALGAACVCTWGFGGGWYDVPICFGVGLFIGYLQFYLSSRSNLYSSVFEVTASIVVAFVTRGIGSIKDGKLFCFGALAQGSLALILPGYIILCGSLELQSKNLVAGSVRMFYAIIYSLFLGFGITLGASLYGWVDHSATNQAQCLKGHAIDDKWRILFVPLYSMVLGLINQARFAQLPLMIIISSVAYVCTYFAGKHFQNVTEFTASIGAFVIGILGNMYSRIGKGMAVSAMLPAIFVQVPSGIASKSTLLAGVNTANKITNSTKLSETEDTSSLSFGATMVEVSIGISVGLFAAALVVYPFGKRRTGLFTL